MLKTLQLYTICIVIIVIVLSQISIFSNGNKSTSFVNSDSTKPAKSSDESGLIEGIKNSKYGEPLSQITGLIDSVNSSKKKVNNGIDELTNLLDIEKNINDLYDYMDE